jgi:hypothetical protein
MAYNGLHHFLMSSLFWFYPKKKMFVLFFNKVHKIGWTSNIEGDKFWNNKSLACDVQNKELPNVSERSIKIKKTLPTLIWSMTTSTPWTLKTSGQNYPVAITHWEPSKNIGTRRFEVEPLVYSRKLIHCFFPAFFCSSFSSEVGRDGSERGD